MSTGLQHYICQNCDAPYAKYSNYSTYCSLKCTRAGRRKHRHENLIDTICKNCEKTFRKERSSNRKYCTRECRPPVYLIRKKKNMRQTWYYLKDEERWPIAYSPRDACWYALSPTGKKKAFYISKNGSSITNLEQLNSEDSFPYLIYE